MLKTDLFLARRLALTVGTGFALSLLLMAALTFIGLRELAATDARLKRIVEQNSVKSQLANQMRDILRGRAISMLTIVVVNDPFEKDREMIRFYELGSHYQSTRLELEPMLSDPEEVDLLQNIDNLTRINQPLMVRTVDLGLEGYTFLAFDLLQREAIPLQRQLIEKLDVLIGLQRKSTEAARVEAEKAYENTRWLMLVLGFAAAGIAIVVAVVVIRRTARLTGETERERTKFQTLFETNTEGIVILDRERFLECNPATLEIFRMPSEQEFLARRPEDLGMPRQQDGHSAAALAHHYIREAFEHGHALFTWQGRRADGSTFPAEVALHAMHIGGQDYIQAIIRDITTQKEAEDALHEAHAAALATAEMKSQFVANVSHEIRTPMNGIIGMTHLLLGSELTPRQREQAEAISQSAEALLRIINDLLDFSKIEAGRLSVEEISFDLPALLSDVMELYKPRAHGKGLDFTLQRSDKLPQWVLGDPLRIRQILLNLLDNALKFTDKGSVQLVVSPAQDGHHPPIWRFTVRDTGVGIPAKAQTHIFEAFAQADGSTSRKFGGTGLGLTICSQLADLMGGRLSLDSQAGSGSAFHLDLPLTPTTAPSDEKVASEGDTLHFDNVRILVAEDNPINQKLTRFMLEHLGIEVIIEADGKAAYQRLQSTPVDLVLMDCQMPEWDGLTTSKAIRAWEADHHRGRLPIVALTANAMAGFAEICKQAGMDDYLSKPLREDDLAATLQRWLPDRVTRKQVEQDIVAAVPATAGAVTETAFDLAKIRRLCRDDAPQVAEMLHLFINSTEPLLASQAEAALARDGRQCARQAHQIKGAAAYIGATEMAELAAAVEQAARQEDWDALPELLEDIEAAFIRVKLAMEAHF